MRSRSARVAAVRDAQEGCASASSRRAECRHRAVRTRRGRGAALKRRTGSNGKRNRAVAVRLAALQPTASTVVMPPSMRCRTTRHRSSRTPSTSPRRRFTSGASAGRIPAQSARQIAETEAKVCGNCQRASGGCGPFLRRSSARLIVEAWLQPGLYDEPADRRRATVAPRWDSEASQNSSTRGCRSSAWWTIPR